MENLYTEFLVKKKADFKTLLIRAAVILGFILLIIGCIMLFLISDVAKQFAFVFPVVLIFAALLGVYIIRNTVCEYEYAIVSGYFQLDVIYAKSNRKRICEEKLSEAEFCVPVNENNASMISRKSFNKIYDASESEKSANRFAMSCKDAKLGQVLIYFNADARVMDCLKYYNRNAVDRGDL